MKKFSILVYIILGMLTNSTLSLHSQDTIYLNGTNRVDFALNRTINTYWVNCNQSYAPASTTVRSLASIGKFLVKADGSGYIIPISGYKGVWKFYIPTCGLLERSVTFTTKPVIVTPPPTNVFSYEWKGAIGNTSSIDWGPTKIKGLRSATSVAEMGGNLYVTTGFGERTGSLLKISITNPTTSKPIPGRNGDISLEGVCVASDDSRVYMVGFDPHAYDVNGGTGYSSKIDCAVVAYDINDKEVLFQYGQKTSCTIQDNPYASLIAVIRNDTNQRPLKITVDNQYLYVYTKANIKKYDKLTGLYLSMSANTETALSTFTRNGVTITMTTASVTYNGKVLCSAQTSSKVDNYNYSTKDINHSKTKGSVYIGSDGSFWVCDVGNSRILHYSSAGTYINQIAYVPMNYNCSVDRNNPTRVFAGVLEYKVSYPSLSWELVANWSYGLHPSYLPIPNIYENTAGFMRGVVTIGAETFAILDSVVVYYNADGSKGTLRYPCKFKLTTAGAKRVKVFDMFANIYLDKQGNDYWLTYNENIGEQNKLYRNGVLIYTAPKITDKSASYRGNGGFVYTSDSTLILYNGEKNSTTNYHLEFHKNGVTPRCISLVSENRFPQGDTFCIYSNGGSPASRSISNCNDITVFMYSGEGFMNGQTTKLFIYKAGKHYKTIGKTYTEAVQASGTNDGPKEYAGNAREGDLVNVNGTYYYFFNDEHGGALQCFIISGI